MNRTTTRWAAGPLIACVLIVMPSMTKATTTVTVNVTVVQQPCVVNNNVPITVDFGEVMTTRVDGNNYREEVPYALDCTAGAPTSLKLGLFGGGASFDPTVLDTNKADLGIAMRHGEGNLPLNLNTWLNFTYPNNPVLWAVPVERPGAALAGGAFSATATLSVDYQ